MILFGYLKSMIAFMRILNLVPNIYGVFDSKFFCNLYISSRNLLIVLYFLKQHQTYRFKILSVISCTDFPELYHRFELTYTLMSIDFPFILNIKLKVAEFSNIDSSSLYYKSAVWLEREIWDLFGVYFINNFDLRRILTDYGFPYYPLRKTFPLQGFNMIRYNYIKKKVTYMALQSFQMKPGKRVDSPWHLVI